MTSKFLWASFVLNLPINAQPSIPTSFLRVVKIAAQQLTSHLLVKNHNSGFPLLWMLATRLHVQVDISVSIRPMSER